MADETMKRPKSGSYPTFTSRKKGSTKCFQKARYGLDEFKTRKLVDEKVSVTFQEGAEFDVYQECLGDGKDFKGNSYFVKLVTEGYLSNGKTVKLDPAQLQKWAESQVMAETNRIYLWKDRPRTAEALRLEREIAGKDALIEKANTDRAKMEALLKKHNIKFEEG